VTELGALLPPEQLLDPAVDVEVYLLMRRTSSVSAYRPSIRSRSAIASSSKRHGRGRQW